MNHFKIFSYIMLYLILTITNSFSQQKVDFENRALKYVYDNLDSFHIDDSVKIHFSYKSMLSLNENHFLFDDDILKKKGLIKPNRYSKNDSLQNTNRLSSYNLKSNEHFLSKFFLASDKNNPNLRIYKRFFYDDFVYIYVLIRNREFGHYLMLKYSKKGKLLGHYFGAFVT